MTEAGAAQKEVAPVRLWDIATPVSVMHPVPIGWTTHTMSITRLAHSGRTWTVRWRFFISFWEKRLCGSAKGCIFDIWFVNRAKCK